MVIVAGARPADLPRLGVDLHGPLSLQLFGSFVFLPAGVGQQFNGLPDIPISNFTLRFKAGGLADQRREPVHDRRSRSFPVSFTRLERRHPDQQGERHRSRMQLT